MPKRILYFTLLTLATTTLYTMDSSGAGSSTCDSDLSPSEQVQQEFVAVTKKGVLEEIEKKWASMIEVRTRFETARLYSALLNVLGHKHFDLAKKIVLYRPETMSHHRIIGTSHEAEGILEHLLLVKHDQEAANWVMKTYESDEMKGMRRQADPTVDMGNVLIKAIDHDDKEGTQWIWANRSRFPYSDLVYLLAFAVHKLLERDRNAVEQSLGFDQHIGLQWFVNHCGINPIDVLRTTVQELRKPDGCHSAFDIYTELARALDATTISYLVAACPDRPRALAMAKIAQNAIAIEQLTAAIAADKQAERTAAADTPAQGTWGRWIIASGAIAVAAIGLTWFLKHR